MGRINTEYYIARRLTGSRSPDNRNIMVRIATVTVAISISVMIISLAVISGFKKELTGKLTGFGADIQVTDFMSGNSFESVPVTVNPELLNNIVTMPGIRSAHVYAEKGGIIKTPEAMQGILLKGYDTAYDWDFYRANLVEGALPRVTDSVRHPDMLISLSLSRLLKIGVDDQVEVLFIQDEQRPRRDRYKVTGIYNTGFEELDVMVVATGIKNIRRVNDWNDMQVTGYEIYLDNHNDNEKMADRIYDAIVETPATGNEILTISDIRERYPNLFDWLKAHNVNAAVIITIMLLVALLNMVSALLIILLERTRMIGVLKSLGMDNGALQKLFLIRTSYIILKGMVWGNIFGIGICLIQRYFGLLKLDQSGYFLDTVPIDLQAGWLVVVNIAAFAILVALLTLPTSIISRINPETTIRYQ